jgi:hypothetical protein
VLLAERFEQVDAIDLSGPMIELARQPRLRPSFDSGCGGLPPGHPSSPVKTDGTPRPPEHGLRCRESSDTATHTARYATGADQASSQLAQRTALRGLTWG